VHWLWFCLTTLAQAINTNMIYIAVLFMCLNNGCHVISSETIYKNKEVCKTVIDQEEKRHKNKFDVFEARCIGIKNELI
jgi:NADH:ubiquinone oxidoreductase subunit E